MLIAPVLALIAWYGVDQLVAERPHAAQPGAAYSLIAKSNCRYASGRCDLENGDLQIRLRADAPEASRILVTLETVLPLQGAYLGFGSGAPSLMLAADQTAQVWQGELEWPAPDETLRFVAHASDATWYAELSSVFLESQN